MTSVSRACEPSRCRRARDAALTTEIRAFRASGAAQDRGKETAPSERNDRTDVRGARNGVLAWVLFVAVAFVAGCHALPPPLPTNTAPFIGPRDFSGTYTPRWSDATTGGEATYHGNIVFTNLARSIVQAALPAELKLANNTLSPGMHPVIYLFGHPMNSRWIIADTPILPGPNYQELMLLVPFVQSASGKRWHNYVVRMYLDDLTAIAIGNLFFAYAKEWGTAQESGTQVTEFSAGAAYFHADIQTTGPWRTSAQADTALPNFKAIKTILDMPVVGRTQEGNLICSYFELNFDGANVASVQSRHEFLQPFRSGMGGWVALGTLVSVPDGAIAIRDLNWRIRQPPPLPCRF